jgi:Tol biopolymer transport system component
MGQVWRARDPKLNRDLALKVLPDTFADDPARLARFRREAQTLAALNHPNIAHIHGIEESNGVLAIVMELVEGEDLFERLKRGPIDLDEALPIARQIAEALEAAHDSGIIHRDLKPANVKVRPDGTVKVLDFGLAKPIASLGGDLDTPIDLNSPTITSPAMTMQGAILGTAAYMAPEQARGRAIDRRVDIWAFGCVLFEMLCGRCVFRGDNVQDLLADVLRQDVDWTRLPKSTPPRLQRLLERCLDRDPRTRLRDAGEARIEIAKIAAGAPDTPPLPMAASSPRWIRIAPWVVTVSALALAVALWAPWRSPAPDGHPLMRLDVGLGPDATIDADGALPVAISPDGTRIVFLIRGTGGKTALATRRLDHPDITPLPGTDNGDYPFFSPDGRFVGFFADSKLKTVALDGGSPAVLADVSAFRGASWGDNGEIVAGLTTIGGLRRLPAAGGVLSTITTLSEGEFLHLRPQVLPGGRAVLFTATTLVSSLDGASIKVVSLADAAGGAGVVKTLVTNAYAGRYVATYGSTGHLVFLRQGALYGVAFDPGRLEVSGAAQPVVENLRPTNAFTADPFDISSTGTLVYYPGRAADQAWPTAWLDDSGKTAPLINAPGRYSQPRFSPDGRRMAIVADTEKGQEIFIYDLQTEAMSRLTFTDSQKRAPVWTPDGAHIVFANDDAAGPHMDWIRADGSGEAHVLFNTKGRVSFLDMSRDGRMLAFHDNTPAGDTNMWTVTLDLSDPAHPKAGTPTPYLQTPAGEAGPVFSPDGRWIAYFSNESGRFQIYVKTAPGSDGKPGPGTWQVSTDGGIFPVWSPNGRELFYRSNPGAGIMVANVTTTAGTFAATRPRTWSDRPIRRVGTFVSYALAPDGKRFAVFPLAPTDSTANAQVTFVLNLFDELRRRVPGP